MIDTLNHTFADFKTCSGVTVAGLINLIKQLIKRILFRVNTYSQGASFVVLMVIISIIFLPKVLILKRLTTLW